MMSANVSDLCKQQGVTMLELADRTGLELLRVRAICLGRWTPSPQERQKIAEVLNASPEDIAWGHQTPIQHIYGHGPD
ncbi:MAG: helix-turn-helix transcriptional regulator [Pirellulaceae bacterium]|nr:helix-turn-helix transcriptional regulator [Pirellulaceae bacterium]